MTRSRIPAAGPWRPTHPNEALKLLSSAQFRWWIAGGWALDLFVGSWTRPHEDLDIGILRRDVPRLVDSMPGWELFEAKDGRLQRLDRRTPESDVHSLWCRPIGQREWTLELLLDESEGNSWVFRRERSIRRALDSAIAHTTDRIPYLVPEIQLLYKARRTRPKDDADFHRVAPCLDSSARAWLRDALARLDARHDWLHALEDSCAWPTR
jgi:hypothetical protein